MIKEINIHQAKAENTDEICRLINSAYRGEPGWTNETHIVAGERTNTNDLVTLLNKTDSHMLIATHNQKIIACICLDINEQHAYIGSFAVSPEYQNTGIGKKTLNFAENFAINHLGINKLIMSVISQRTELIEFYERRGYRRTGKKDNYPVHLNVGMPLVEGLTIERLEKHIY